MNAIFYQGLADLGFQVWIVLCTTMLVGAGPSGTKPGCRLERPEVSEPFADWLVSSDMEAYTQKYLDVIFTYNIPQFLMIYHSAKSSS